MRSDSVLSYKKPHLRIFKHLGCARDLCNFASSVAFAVVCMIEAVTSVLRHGAPSTSDKLDPDRPVSGWFENAGNGPINHQPESANAFFVNGSEQYPRHSIRRVQHPNVVQNEITRFTVPGNSPVYYAYSHSRDNVDTTLSVLALRNSYMFYPDDLTYNFVANYTYNLPFDGVFASLLRRLTQGWIIHDMATGFPATRKALGAISLTGTGLDFRNVVEKITTQSPREPGVNRTNQVFDSGRFVPEGRGQISDSGFRSFHGSSRVNMAPGLMKSTRITESTILVQAGSFNIFNHANFTNGVGNFSSGPFRQTTNKFPVRWVN
jgi:hypothetical protein